MPKFRLNTRTLALLAVCATLWGCPATVGTGGTPSFDDEPDTGGGSFLGQSTPKPNTSPTPKPSSTPTPAPTGTPAPTPAPTGTPGPTPTPQAPRLQSVRVLNPISQMWLLEQVPTASPPVSIPSTYSFRAEAVTRLGALLSTSSAVVWSSSNPAILSIDASTGYASTNVAQGFFLVEVRAASSNPLTGDSTPQIDTMEITVGNSGTLDVTIE